MISDFGFRISDWDGEKRPASRFISNPQSAIRNPQFAFTLIEMLVVLGIIGLVAAMSIPMLIPFMRGRKAQQSADIVKSACVFARSRAVKQRRRFCVTLLERERKVIVNDYDQLRYMLPVQEAGTTADNSASANPQQELLRDTYTDDQKGYYVTLTDIAGLGFGQQALVTSRDAGTHERLILNNDWTAQSSWVYPATGETYLIGGTDSGNVHNCLCPHQMDNFTGANSYFSTCDTDEEVRDKVLTDMAVIRPRELPEGCRFDLDADGSNPRSSEPQGWTYIFLPTGGVVTLNTAATNENNADWSETTYQSGGALSGPRIYGPDDKNTETIIVYAMTGQATSK